jgi:hypothetical protein
VHCGTVATEADEPISAFALEKPVIAASKPNPATALAKVANFFCSNIFAIISPQVCSTDVVSMSGQWHQLERLQLLQHVFI